MGLIVREIELKVHLAYDEEADRWFVAESDIPGLRLEAETAAALVERIGNCAQEMIELNATEIMEAHETVFQGLTRRLGARRKTAAGRPVAVRPVFDSPMRLAHAG